MLILTQKINWTGSDATEAHLVQSKSITKEEAKKRLQSLNKKIESFLSEANELYQGAPTSELYSVITIAENIIRELDKLK